MTFDEAIALRPAGDGSYDVSLDPGWSIGSALNGGYLLALLDAAAVDALPHPHAVATSGHFLAPPAPGPARVRVQVLRTGRAVSAAQAVLEQDGEAKLAALVTAAELTGGPPSYSAAPLPPLPSYDACLPARGPLPDGTVVGLLDRVDLRLDPSTAGWVAGRPTGALEMRAWFGLPEAAGAPLDPRVMALAVDALPPTPFNLGVSGWCPTVELTCFARALPAPGPLAVHLSGRLARDGWVDEEAEVYDATGALVGQARQLARLPR